MTSQPVTEVRPIGGEMLRWSDDESDERPAGGAALAELVRRAVPAGRRTLVLGPHLPHVVDQLAERGDPVTFLVRSLPDARRLLARHRGRPVEILCGAFDCFAPAEPYDVIVALDGVRRLVAPERPVLGWADCPPRLASMLAKDGILLLGVPNPLGLHRLVAADAAVPGAVKNWTPQPDATTPAAPGAVRAALAHAGLRVDHLYAGYPFPDRLAALLAEPVCAAPGPELADAVGVICQWGAGDRLILGDPRRLAVDAFRAGVGSHLAAGWITVATAPGSAGPSALPGVLVVEGADDPMWAVPMELAHDPEGNWSRRLGTNPPGERTAGRLKRAPARLAGRIPSGRRLEDVLLEVCAEGDLARLRDLLTGYAGWLSAGGLGAGAAFATVDNVAVDQDRFALLDPSWTLTETIPGELALGRVLLRFALTLLAGGYQHPWPPTLTLHEITELLQVAAGHPADQRLRRAAIMLEAEITSVRRGLVAGDRTRIATALMRGDINVPEQPRTYRDLVAAHAALTEDLRAVRARARWAERRLAKQEARLAAKDEKLTTLRRRLRQLRGSTTFRTGRMVTAPGRAFVRLARNS